MKLKLKEKAIRLRKSGLSYNEIMKKLNNEVSKSTLSLWLRDIKLSEHKQKRLHDNNPANGINTNYERLREAGIQRRKNYQKNGEIECKNMNLHLLGCMLYWAEGANDKHSVRFTNTDVEMLKIFIKFLKECFGLKPSDILFKCHIHVNLQRNIEEVEEYWRKQLELPKSSLRKHTVEVRDNKSKKLKYQNGCCTIMVHKTEIAQRIFGAIKCYSGSQDKDKWI
jgi:hypothetical protein